MPIDWERRGYRLRSGGEGHSKGYAWAAAQGITDPSQCGGNSASFIEGCQEYAKQVQAQQMKRWVGGAYGGGVVDEEDDF